MFFTQVLSVILGLGVAHVAAVTPETETEQAIVEKVYVKYVNSDDPASVDVPLGECVNVNLPDKVEAYQLESHDVTCRTWPILDCAGDPNPQAWDLGGNFLDPSQGVLSIRCAA